MPQEYSNAITNYSNTGASAKIREIIQSNQKTS